jgi:FkbM family methyltransferase
MVSEGSVVYDIGAHVGFYTLLASVLVGTKGKVVAFEPLPKNVRYLKKHLRLNRCNNVMVIESAVAEYNDIAFLKNGKNSYAGSLSSEGHLKIKTVSLDDLISKSNIPPPDFMKIDVEGAELAALTGSRLLLAEYHPTIFLATYGIERHQRCCELLSSIDYDLQSINGKSINESDEIIAFEKK